mmetsp:Transcript_26440/g.40957  ORF Transcript_26440/g.40957 Transcript_26440/m.40957 type:complete len:151 (-) Transcript_26440:475-927(-)
MGTDEATLPGLETIPATDRDLPSDRFELELEFLQMLASPAYLHYLAINDYLSDSSFIEFLKYLKYWKRPEYVKFVSYPHSLYFLDLLTNNERFRRELKNVAFRDFVHQQQFECWRHRGAQFYGRGLKKKVPPPPVQQEDVAEAAGSAHNL